MIPFSRPLCMQETLKITLCSLSMNVVSHLYDNCPILFRSSFVLIAILNPTCSSCSRTVPSGECTAEESELPYSSWSKTVACESPLSGSITGWDGSRRSWTTGITTSVVLSAFSHNWWKQERLDEIATNDWEIDERAISNNEIRNIESYHWSRSM